MFIYTITAYYATDEDITNDYPIGDIDVSNSGIDIVVEADNPLLITHVNEKIVLNYDTQIIATESLGDNIAIHKDDVDFDSLVPDSAIKFIQQDMDTYNANSDTDIIDITNIETITDLGL
jgi:hypothetical protein